MCLQPLADLALRLTGEAFSDGELRLYIEPGGDYRDDDDRVSEASMEPYGSELRRAFVIKVQR